MARNTFGGASADAVWNVAATNTLISGVGATVQMWSAATGGSQYTDLLVGGSPATTVTAGAEGILPTFQGPDGITTMYADAGGGSRVRLDSLTVKVGWTNHSIMEYANGATIYDGTTSAASAITAALAAIPSGNQRLWFPPGTYLDDAARTISKGVQIVGDGATIKKGTTVVSGNWWLLSAAGIKLNNLTFDDSGSHVTGTLLAGALGQSNITVEDCTINAPAALAIWSNQNTDIRVYRNTITACKEGIHILSTSARPDIRNNHVQGWLNYGITLVGDATGASSGAQVVNNTISNMVYNGTNRYPIQFAAATNQHTDVLIEGNSIFGGGKSFNDATNHGNADCISVFATVGVRILGNLVRDGGDMGITVDGTGLGAKNASIVGNTCLNNDTGGICVANAAQDVAITGNVCKNNGQNRNSDRTAQARAGVRLVTTGTNIAIAGNTFGDDQGTKTQQYGVCMTACTNVSIGPDVDAGNAVALYLKDGVSNTNINKVTTAAF